MAKSNPSITEPYLTAYATIGMLTANWASYESAFYGLLRDYIEGRPDKIKASTVVLINGLRYGDAVTTFARIMTENGEHDETVKCFKEITGFASKVKAIRDIVAHRQFNIIGLGTPTIYQFYLWNRKTLKKSYFACYEINEIYQCSMTAMALQTAITSELSKRLKLYWVHNPESPQGFDYGVLGDHDLAWRDRPAPPGTPEEEPQRCDNNWIDQLVASQE